MLRRIVPGHCPEDTYRGGTNQGTGKGVTVPATQLLCGVRSGGLLHLLYESKIGNISDKHCALTFVDRKSGYVMIGKLEARTVEATNRRAVRMIKNAARTTHTVTADNGTEFHGYKAIEAAT